MRERTIELNDAIPVIQEKLALGGEVLFSPNGISMLPTLKAGRDIVVLVAPTGRLKKYDIALFRRDNGKYVLHRVVESGETYTFIGDNQFVFEKNIEHRQIIAVCVAYVRRDKRVELDSFRCKAYARFWHYTRFLRKLWRRGWAKIKSIFK